MQKSELEYENECVPIWNGCYVQEWLPLEKIPARVQRLTELGWTFSKQWKSRGGYAWFEVWCEDIRDLIAKFSDTKKA